MLFKHTFTHYTKPFFVRQPIHPSIQLCINRDNIVSVYHIVLDRTYTLYYINSFCFDALSTEQIKIATNISNDGLYSIFQPPLLGF